MVKNITIRQNHSPSPHFDWPDSTELVGLNFELTPTHTATLYPQYTIALHAWFLDQVRQYDPKLSAYLHDDQGEKSFTLSGLEANFDNQVRQLQLIAGQSYQWSLNLFSKSVVEWAKVWLQNIPETINIRATPLKIENISLSLAPTTYQQLFNAKASKTTTLSFTSPTSFRRKGHHFPLPVPNNLYHSYLRRWNDFSGMNFDSDKFLSWIDEQVIINRHYLESVKVAAGKKGTVTAFLGAIELALTSEAYNQNSDFVQLYFALSHFAAYCGTGHKTTFGLGQTKLGWLTTIPCVEILAQEHHLAKRIDELTDRLMASQKRTGGERALKVCQTRACILARRENGESLEAIASDLEMPYQTVKTYAKLARRLLIY